MKFQDFELHAPRVVLELEEGVPYADSSVCFYLRDVNLDLSPSLQDESVKSYLESFQQFGDAIGVEVDEPVANLKKLPGVFVSTIYECLNEFVVEMNKYLDAPYVPAIDNLRAVGFFPSRPGQPVREINQQGEVFEGGVKIGKEYVGNPPEWALDLISDAQQYSNLKYNHHKISSTGKRKVYGVVSSFCL
jgi:hypothetical protein